MIWGNAFQKYLNSKALLFGMEIYEPREDSFLIQKYIAQYAKGNVLDMCTGSGILARTAAQAKKVVSVAAVDLNSRAVAFVKQQKIPKIKVVHSDLFQNVRAKFDLIICNPPYLPDDKKYPDLALDGGKHGYELTIRFLDDLNTHLKTDGKCLLLFSSLTKKEKIDEKINQELLTSKCLEQQSFSFETLYVYLIEKAPLLKQLEKDMLTSIHYFTHGKRGYLYRATYKKREVVIKIKHPESTAYGTILKEAAWLKKLNVHGIGPKLLFATQDYVVYEYAQGDLISDFLKKTESKKRIQEVLLKILKQCSKLDALGVTKEEMHHPLKHIVVDTKRNVTFLDFERAHYGEDPKNVTQLCQFYSGLIPLLAEKGIVFDRAKLSELAKAYKSQKRSNALQSYLKQA